MGFRESVDLWIVSWPFLCVHLNPSRAERTRPSVHIHEDAGYKKILQTVSMEPGPAKFNCTLRCFKQMSGS